MKKDLILEEIKQIRLSKKKEFDKTMEGYTSDCIFCKARPEGKYCSRSCHLETVFRFNKAEYIAELMVKHFNIKKEDEEDFYSLLEILEYKYY